MTRILVVEDNDAVAKGILLGLQAEGFSAVRAATVAQAESQVERADAIVLDIRLPDGSGFDLCRRLRAQGHLQPILMLTARDETVDKIIGLEVGADDYMTKPFELRELVARLRALLRRSYGDYAAGTAERVISVDLQIDLARHRVTRAGEELHLTTTEFRLLSFLARRPGQPQSRETLLREVWGYEGYVGDPRTVDVHIRNLRQKVEVTPDRPQLIVTVRGAGYMFAAPAEDPANVK